MNIQNRISTFWAAAAVLVSASGGALAQVPDQQKLLDTLDAMAAATGELAPIRAPRPVAAATDDLRVADVEPARVDSERIDPVVVEAVNVVGAVEAVPAPAVPHLAGAPAEAALPAAMLPAATPRHARSGGMQAVEAGDALGETTADEPTTREPTAQEKKAAGTPLAALKDREIESSGRVGWLAVGMALALLAGVTAWLKRRTAKTATMAGLRIETISTTRLGGKHAVSLIKVGGRVLVVGQGEKGLTLLTELDDEEAAPAAPSAAPRGLSSISGTALGVAANTNGSAVETGAGSFVEKVTRLRAGWKDPAATSKAASNKSGIRFPTDPFHAAMLDDAPVDELQRLDERAQIRERLEQLRRRSVAVA
jgi:flagellar biogenesis protein FliO